MSHHREANELEANSGTLSSPWQVEHDNRQSHEVNGERATNVHSALAFDGTFDLATNPPNFSLPLTYPLRPPRPPIPSPPWTTSLPPYEPSPATVPSPLHLPAALAHQDRATAHRPTSLDRELDLKLAQAGLNDGLPPGNTIVIRGLGLEPRNLRSSGSHRGIIEGAPFAVGREARKVLLATDGQRWTTQVWGLFQNYLLEQGKEGRDPVEIVRSEDTKAKGTHFFPPKRTPCRKDPANERNPAEIIATLSHALLTYPALLDRTEITLQQHLGPRTVCRHLLRPESQSSIMGMLYQHLAGVCRGASDRTAVVLGGEELMAGMENAALVVWELEPWTVWKVCWIQGEGEVLVPEGERTRWEDARVVNGGGGMW
ncbi:hypothetical protein EJ03DRAFT_372466 [Teratosphaeria nubilosa]|uniref:Uncharacterized protein n=1 Tax=Teratosphaeria nubilosa TaxID=161662 RepID=A0A6G1LH04_9PEZI|nr:hypothetical protein EJ03DRAFT_372466 [Teratosphaeria nubilosa]